MHDYHLSFMAGFLSCVPRDKLPNVIRNYIEKKFFASVPHKNGEAELAVLPLRKIEAFLIDNGFSCVVSPPQQTHMHQGAKLFMVSTMDPFGLGPATTTMVGLAGGKEPYNKFFYERLITTIRKQNPQAKIITGGPGVWEFEIMQNEKERLGIDCVVRGDVEGMPLELLRDAVAGKEIPKQAKGGMRTFPHLIKKPSFWGMVEISRGCGRGCQFCDLELMSGVRWLPKEHILKEIEVNVRCSEVKTITLLSEDILRYGTALGEWKPNESIVELAKAVKAYGLPISLTHCTFASALANPKVTEEFAEVCGYNEKSMSGFQTGIESGSSRMVTKYMKGKL